ncbi:MAG TPA: bifunctional oligoribonuclease/PAP phosphatase NrnA [Terracidiphilus sp.]|jgi:phosphoesterase RecJ-like protein|nr:bifunctional oligoribonuclease/PAP phosphatase NrnA [Terracidiphilus sp.]
MNPNPLPTAFDEAAPANEPADRIAAILRMLNEGERFVVCSHSRPDGDAVGSMLAFGMLLEQMGKRADLVTADRIPPVYRSLPGAGAIQTVLGVHGHYDAAILLECDGLERTRLHGLEAYRLINIDHHISGRAFAHLNWIDHGAASTGELVYRLVKAAGAQVTAEMARCLYTTVLTDTGAFCYGALGASTFALARELVLAGADPIAIAREIYFAVPASKVMLLGAALSTLRQRDGVAWLWITPQDMARIHAAEEDCEGIVNFALGISGVEAAVFLRELPEGPIRLSLRGKGRVNVAAIAEKLGGGGHESAAGCTLEGPLDRALEQILAELRAAVSAPEQETPLP